MNPNAQPTRVESFDRSALAQLLEPPYTDPYARWCGRGGAARLPPIPIIDPHQTSEESCRVEGGVRCKRCIASATDGMLFYATELHYPGFCGMSCWPHQWAIIQLFLNCTTASGAGPLQ